MLAGPAQCLDVLRNQTPIGVQRRPARLTGPPRFAGVPGRTPTPFAPISTVPTPGRATSRTPGLAVCRIINVLAVNDSVRRVWYRRGDPECQNSKGKDRRIPHDNLYWNTGNHLNQEQLRLLDLNQLQVRR